MGKGSKMKIKTMALWIGFLALPCYLIDQWTKWLIYTHMEIGSGFTVIPGFFDIIHARNTGAAFGMLQGLPESYRTLFFHSHHHNRMQCYVHSFLEDE